MQIQKNLETHGLHPRFVHFLINVPLLYNILGIIGLLTVGKMFYSGLKGRWLNLPKIQGIVGLMHMTFITPIFLLSIFPHQEPRFILPVLFPLVFLYAPQINHVPCMDIDSRSHNDTPRSIIRRYKPNKLQLCWYICNIGLCVFYGFVHQGGVLPLTSHIATELKAKPYLTHLHLYTSYTYSIPTALLHLRNTRKTYISSGNHKYRLTKDFYLYEEGSKNLFEVCNDINLKIAECEDRHALQKIPYRLYYALPASAVDQISQCSIRNDSRLFNYRVVKAFYPHISLEKLLSINSPLINVHDIFDLYNTNLSVMNLVKKISNHISQFLEQFGLILLKIETSTIK